MKSLLNTPVYLETVSPGMCCTGIISYLNEKGKIQGITLHTCITENLCYFERTYNYAVIILLNLTSLLTHTLKCVMKIWSHTVVVNDKR